MYSVRLTRYSSEINKPHSILEIPFNDKETAIAFFNYRCDSVRSGSFSLFNLIELYHDKDCLFDYEV